MVWYSHLTKGTFHAKIGTIKDRNGAGLTEACDRSKRSVYIPAVDVCFSRCSSLQGALSALSSVVHRLPCRYPAS